MPQSTSFLENIPVEVLARICEQVGLVHRPSLLSISLASKHCHAVAKRLFFHTIQFTVSAKNLSQLEPDVTECMQTLKRNAALSNVRILIIGRRDRDEQGDTPSWSFGRPPSLSELVDGDKDRLRGLERRSPLVPARWDDYGPDVALQEDTAWQHLASLVQILNGLADLVYAGPSQIPLPPCLLQSLLQHQPSCRLHDFNVRLRSLSFPRTDPGELALITAPCLHSIWMVYSDTNGLDDWSQPSYHAEAVLSMVKGLAPNLKEVHLLQSPGEAYDYGHYPLDVPCPPWKGFTNIGSGLTSQPAQLESLELGLNSIFSAGPHPTILDQEDVDSWIASATLSSLRALRISRIVSHGALQSLIQSESLFTSLTTLLFTCAEKQEHAYYDDVKQYISRLPRLTSLEVTKWPLTKPLAPALPTGLRELWLRTRDILGQSLSEAFILDLAARCPRITTLALKIRRSRGSPAEVALYKALGRFTHLRRLALILDASPPPWQLLAPSARPKPRDESDIRRLAYDTPIDPSFDEFDKEYLDTGLYPYRNGHIRDVFINTAVDETLARAIFHIICAAQEAHGNSPNPAPLERFVIHPEGGLSFPHQATMRPVAWGLRTYLGALGRRWLLERDVHYDRRETIYAREVDEKLRPRRKDSFGERGNKVGDSPYMPIFRRLWPGRPDVEGSWRDDWCSWPLAVVP